MNTRSPVLVSGVQNKQSGSVLLEALIGILIFSLGILAIVGMQGSAVRASTDAKYRSDASMLANQLIGQMWASNRSAAALQTFTGGGGTYGTAYLTWQADVNALLPGSTGANEPLVTLNPLNNQVTVRLFWLAPGSPTGTTPHQFVTVAQVI